MQLIMKKIDDHACENDKNANDNDPFSGIAVHVAKVRWIDEERCF
jgi:hypothetical protein